MNFAQVVSNFIIMSQHPRNRSISFYRLVLRFSTVDKLSTVENPPREQL